MDAGADVEEGHCPSETTPSEERETQKLRQPDAPVPSGVSLKSDQSMDHLIDFKQGQTSDGGVEQKSSGVHGDGSAQEHLLGLDPILKVLEGNLVTFVKDELKQVQGFLRGDYPEYFERGEEVMDCEDKEQRRSSSEAFLKITVNFLRRMKQEDLAECLQSTKL